MWEIYAYQNSASLFGVFNAAAAIFGSNDFMAAVAAVAFCGFVAALLAYAFAPEKLHGWKWLVTVVMVFSVLITPKVTVGIVDKTGGTPVQVVDNVPFGLAALASLKSTIGHTLTGLFETAFQVIPGVGALPAELSYEQNGLMFGNRLIRETGNAVFQDPNYRTDLINFIHNCTTYDLLDGTLSPATFATSDDVWALMSTPNPARFTPITSGNASSIATCTDAYANLNGRLPAQVSRIQGQLAFQLNPTLSGTVAATVIAGQIQQAYLKNSIANASATAADLIRQNAMLNAIQDTGQIVGQKVNDPAAMILAVGRAQAVAQQNAAWINGGKVAEQALPVFRNVIEAVSYSIFPFVVLMLLLTSGRETMLVLKGYVALLVWIELWPPLYAVLNYMASVYAAYDIASAADLGTGTKVLSLQTASSIYARAISGEAIVGYLTISIPVIAWTIVRRLEGAGSALAGGLSGLQAVLGSTTGAAAVGNTSLGNVSMDQMQLAPNRTSAFMSSLQNDVSGDTYTSNIVTGRTAVSLLRNQGFASRVVSMRVSQQEVQQASQQVDAARSESVAATSERSAALSEVFSRGLNKLRSSRDSRGSTQSSFEQIGDTLNQLDQITQNVARTTGLSQSQVARIAFGASAQAGLKTGIFKAGVDASGDKSYESSLSAQDQKVLASLSAEQLSAFKQFGDRVSRDNSVLQALSSDANEAREMSSRLGSTRARSERADAALADRTSFAKRVSSAYDRGESISIDLAQDPHNMEMLLRYAQTYGGDSAAAHALMSAELARQSLRPNRTLSDGTSLPNSFDEVRELHQREREAPALKPNIGAAHQGNNRTVGRSGSDPSRPLDSVPTPPSPVREEVQRRAAQVHAETTAKGGEFDKKAEIVKTNDGTLESKRSLLWQSGRQVYRDGEATAGNVKEVVQDLLKGKK